MKPEAQRIAIAEACGWVLSSSGKPYGWPRGCSGGDMPPGIIPNYLNDLNAIHEAEAILKDEKSHRFGIVLLDVVESHGIPASRFNHIHASAQHRCEAFLRTIGKWTEDSP